MAKNDALAVITPSDFRAVAIVGTEPGALAEMIRENVGNLSSFDPAPGGSGGGSRPPRAPPVTMA